MTVFSQTVAQAEFSIEALAGGELPMTIGVAGRLNINKNYYARAGYGYVVPGLADSMGSLLATFGQVGPETGKIVMTGLKGSSYIDLRGGYDLSTDGGLYFEAGYSVFLGGSGVFTVIQAENATGDEFTSLTNTTDVEMTSVVHNITLHAGYSWFFENWSIYAEVGLIKPIFGNHTIDVVGVNTTQSQNAEKLIDDYLTGKFEKDIWLTTAGLWGSYNF